MAQSAPAWRRICAFQGIEVVDVIAAAAIGYRQHVARGIKGHLSGRCRVGHAALEGKIVHLLFGSCILDGHRLLVPIVVMEHGHKRLTWRKGTGKNFCGVIVDAQLTTVIFLRRDEQHFVTLMNHLNRSIPVESHAHEG